MKTSDFDYELPQELIAQTPVEPRDSSRLLVYHRDTGAVEHKIFRDVIDYLNPGDVLVVNQTRVIPARLYGVKEGTGGAIEFLLLRRLNLTDWEVILKPGKKAKPGARFVFGNGELVAEILTISEDGGRTVRFFYEGVFEDVLDRLGQMPLPPYIHEKLEDKTRYQTVYAKVDGSAAAAAVGTMLQIKPLLHVDDEGKLRVAEKPRGRKQAIRTQIAHMKEGRTPEMGRLVVIGHGDCPEDAEPVSYTHLTLPTNREV